MLIEPQVESAGSPAPGAYPPPPRTSTPSRTTHPGSVSFLKLSPPHLSQRKPLGAPQRPLVPCARWPPSPWPPADDSAGQRGLIARGAEDRRDGHAPRRGAMPVRPRLQHAADRSRPAESVDSVHLLSARLLSPSCSGDEPLVRGPEDDRVVTAPAVRSSCAPPRRPSCSRALPARRAGPPPAGSPRHLLTRQARAHGGVEAAVGLHGAGRRGRARPPRQSSWPWRGRARARCPAPA